MPDGGKTPWALNAGFGPIGLGSQEHTEMTGCLDVFSLASKPQIDFLFMAVCVSVSFIPSGTLTQYLLSLED